MNTMFLYFAYGSNMNPARMAKRCPGAIDLGGAVLFDYKLKQRLYADIDQAEGAVTHGVLYVISKENLKSLDHFEGYPSVYRRITVNVEYKKRIYSVITYEMEEETKKARHGKKYPENYRKLCSLGARLHNIKNGFIKKRKVTK